MSWARLDDSLPESAKWGSITEGAFCLGIRALCWARKLAQLRKRPGFIPEAMLPALARRNKPAAKKLAQELVDAGAGLHESGIWVPVEGGWMIHDFKVYGPPVDAEAADPESSTSSAVQPPSARTEAARIAGKASADARRARNGTAQPSNVRSNGSNELPNVSPNDSRTSPNESFERSPNVGRSSSQDLSQDLPIPDPKPRSPKPVISKTLQVVGRARGERPIIKSAMHESHDARTWEPPASFSEYALEKGLTELEWHDTLADFREKIRQPRGEVWLGNTLCRFIEQRVARRAEKAGVVPAKDPHPDDVWVFDFWRKTFRKDDALLDEKRAERFAALRVGGMSRADAEAAIRGAAADPWANGKQDGTQRVSLGIIFGDRERYERFRDAGRELMRRARPDLARAPVKTLEEQGFVPPPPEVLEELGLDRGTSPRDAVAAIVAGLGSAVVK